MMPPVRRKSSTGRTTPKAMDDAGDTIGGRFSDEDLFGPSPWAAPVAGQEGRATVLQSPAIPGGPPPAAGLDGIDADPGPSKGSRIAAFVGAFFIAVVAVGGVRVATSHDTASPGTGANRGGAGPGGFPAERRSTPRARW
ncbi:MAG: hypothetical protein QOG43_3289 [Actinomycetota bacterium]|jgi:hypothetical protein|nr:hypothetical protein [Actinomycetota bacterium]